MTSGHGGRRTETQGIKYRNNNSKDALPRHPRTPSKTFQSTFIAICAGRTVAGRGSAVIEDSVASRKLNRYN